MAGDPAASTPAAQTITLTFPAAGTYPVELDTPLGAGAPSLVLGTPGQMPLMPAA